MAVIILFRSSKTALALVAVLLLFILAEGEPVEAGGQFRIDSETLDKAEKKFGTDARARLQEWEDLIRLDASRSDIDKLQKVNRFFNRMEFVNDIRHWGETDYWATPVEFLASQGGDCEDFTIAKYFTLKAMGVAEEKLNLTYVKALRLNEHHMVLTYYSEPGAEPLVLDNIVKIIKPASKRSDLLPIYSFNGTGLWLAKQRQRGKLLGGSERLSRWQDLLQRMPQALLQIN